MRTVDQCMHLEFDNDQVMNSSLRVGSNNAVLAVIHELYNSV